VRPLPYENAGANAVFIGLFAIWVAAELRVRFRSRRNQQGTNAEWGSVVAIIVSFGLGAGLGFHAASHVESAAITFARWPVFILGALVMAAGIAFRQWAIAVLGVYFTAEVRVSENQSVVEGGPYRWLAHPSYTGIIVTLVGVGLMLGNWISLASLTVLPAVGLVMRIKVEERALVAGIGEPYRRFLATRSRLIPGVW
jgi:protein-S-isoprenylcysteine O-methyltransferase Ste14